MLEQRTQRKMALLEVSGDIILCKRTIRWKSHINLARARNYMARVRLRLISGTANVHVLESIFC